MKMAKAVFIRTADELTTVQTYGHENGDSRFHKKQPSSHLDTLISIQQ